jgi:hypothetical protein
VLVLSLVPSLALADEPSQAARVEKQVRDGLLLPLAAYEASMSHFSRVRMPPAERRIRVTQVTPSKDASGRPFMTFAIDSRWGDQQWRENDIVGCAYLTSGDIFVKRGDAFRPSAILLGKPADPVAGVCQVPHA